MKTIITEEEYHDILMRVSMGLNSDITPGSDGHIDDHKATADRLNYFPSTKMSSIKKVGEDEWIMYQDGHETPISSGAIDAQYQMYLDYPEMVAGIFSIVRGAEITLPIGSSLPVGATIDNYMAGAGVYDELVSKQYIRDTDNKIKDFNYSLDSIDVRVREFFDVHAFVVENGEWAYADAPGPEYPITNIYQAIMHSPNGINGFLSFSNNTVNGPEDFGDISTEDYSRIELWVWKVQPDDAKQRIETLEGSNGTLSTTVSDLEADVSTLTTDKETLEGKVSTLESDSATLNTTVSQLEEDITNLSTANSTLEGKVSTLESDNVSLNTTVSGLETDLGTLSSANDTLSSTVSTLEGNVATLTSDKETLEGQVSSLESSNGTLSSTVSTLESTVGELTSDKEALEGQVSTLEGQVSTLESTIANLTSRLEALENPTSPE